MSIYTPRVEPAGGSGALIRPELYARGFGVAANEAIASNANERTYISFLQIGTTVSIDRIAVNVTVAGQSGGTARLGIYGPSVIATGMPLLLDAGTVAVDATGLREITIAQELRPGWYALVCRFAGIASTRPSMTALRGSTTGGGSAGVVWNPGTASTSAYAGASVAAGAGAYEATLDPGTGVDQIIPVVYVRFAA